MRDLFPPERRKLQFAVERLKPVRPSHTPMPEGCPQIPSHPLCEWGNCECARRCAITHIQRHCGDRVNIHLHNICMSAWWNDPGFVRRLVTAGERRRVLLFFSHLHTDTGSSAAHALSLPHRGEAALPRFLNFLGLNKVLCESVTKQNGRDVNLVVKENSN